MTSSTQGNSANDRVAVVTGAGSGIGLSVAQALSEQGHRVALLDRNIDEAQRVAEKLSADGTEAMAYQVDVTDRVGVRAAMDAVRGELGPISIIVTSAGVETFTPVTEISAEEWDHIVAVNLTGTFTSIQAVVPDMIEAGWGRIVTISSSSAQSGAPNMAHYVASKGGVIALTKALSFELAPQGITVNSIPPSIIDTPMARKSEADGDFPGVDVIASMTPVRRAGLPSDVAAACAFLCTDNAGFITGQLIGVNGGWYM
ncbi:SDR family NAD(P)-dependent oxidoreductase [Rhodococcus globerulus]|uniref:SDR family NAD(P)-dependent oxidoreductase n=1 Tax=Rhodococcus globerulus TaxID=33008 RepID=UPI003018ACE5